MAVKAGQIIHDAYGFVIDRIQTGGVNNLNIPEEKIYEVGNFLAVQTIRDIPDLTFDLESWDVSTEIEALLTFTDPTTTVDGDVFDLSTSVPMDIISPIKDGWKVYTASRGVAIPYLSLESATYSFDVRNNTSARYSLRGDSYYFTDGAPYYEEYDGNGVTTAFNFANAPAQVYTYQGKDHYALEVCVVYADKTYKRLFLNTDFTNTATGITLLDADVAPVGSTVKVVYGSATVANYPQTVHEGTSIKPGALKGKDIDVYVGSTDATPVFTRWSSVQSAEINFRLNLDRDQEFGNSQYVSQDHDVPEVSGNIVIRPRDVEELWAHVQEVTNVGAGEVAGPLTSVFVPMEIRVTDPDSGARLKTFYIPDARFKPPALQPRAQQKLDTTFEWTSDGGDLQIYKGARS